MLLSPLTALRPALTNTSYKWLLADMGQHPHTPLTSHDLSITCMHVPAPSVALPPTGGINACQTQWTRPQRLWTAAMLLKRCWSNSSQRMGISTS